EPDAGGVDFEAIPDGVGLRSLSIAPSSVMGSQPAMGTVRLSGPAPAAGLFVGLSSEAPSVASVPTTVAVEPGQSVVTFSIGTAAVSAVTSLTVSASHGGEVRTATLTVAPAELSSLGLSDTTVSAGGAVLGRVALTGPAPAGGAVVSLSITPTSGSAV